MSPILSIACLVGKPPGFLAESCWYCVVSVLMLT